ncbi:MAG TPA: zinc-dependent alcohol dehydrogenase family protein [Terriglobia bacterium]|nr:zinc-dependent alcohol dehydrogenase family protein [Terriglobia bacterium]
MIIVRACVIDSPAPITTNPLQLRELPRPEPKANQVLIRVHACAVCRTDLHVIEGELAPRKYPVIPGHQAVGVVEAIGSGASRIKPGTRAGVAWLHRTDGVCEYCRAGHENLCDRADFTGYTVDGGYADYLLADERFVYALPDAFSDVQAAPLLCAGIIGFRSLRLSGAKPGGRLGFYGFGAAAHLAIQVALHWDMEVYVSTRDERHRRLALELGAKWAGGTLDQPPVALDAAIVFAPAGEIVPAALHALRKGGTVVLAGIYMSPTPPIEYALLYHERVLRSVANNTREDGELFLKVAAEIPIRTRAEVFPLAEANRALNALKNDAINGAAVLDVSLGAR